MVFSFQSFSCMRKMGIPTEFWICLVQMGILLCYITITLYQCFFDIPSLFYIGFVVLDYICFAILLVTSIIFWNKPMHAQPKEERKYNQTTLLCLFVYMMVQFFFLRSALGSFHWFIVTAQFLILPLLYLYWMKNTNRKIRERTNE